MHHEQYSSPRPQGITIQKHLENAFSCHQRLCLLNHIVICAAIALRLAAAIAAIAASAPSGCVSSMQTDCDQTNMVTHYDMALLTACHPNRKLDRVLDL